MITFKTYAAITTVITAAAIAHAWQTRSQFYPTVVYLTNSKAPIVLLTNFAFLLLLLIVRLLIKLFLGQLTREEWEVIISTSKFAITETCLALTIFREELGVALVSLFTILLFSKAFHLLLALRIDALNQLSHFPLLNHLRLIGLLTLLVAVDSLFTLSLTMRIVESQHASVLILFAFEFGILLITAALTGAKYCLTLIDMKFYNESKGRIWHNKPHYSFYLDFVADLIRLCLYALFFALVCAHYGFPLHLVRELGMCFYITRERVRKYVNWRANMRALKEAFKTVTESDLVERDRDCIICREEMFGCDYVANENQPKLDPNGSKKLQCGHMFHFHCLRSWLERSSTCPTCRAEIKARSNPSEQQQHDSNNANVDADNQAHERRSILSVLLRGVNMRSTRADAPFVPQVGDQRANHQSSASASASEVNVESILKNLMTQQQNAGVQPQLPSIDPSMPLPIQKALMAHRTLLLQQTIEALQSQLYCAKLMFEYEIEIQKQTYANERSGSTETVPVA